MSENNLMAKRKSFLYIVSLAAGLLGFLVNVRFFHFTYQGWELSLPMGYIFALYLALEWGTLVSLPAALLSASFLFLDWTNYGWGTLYIYVAHVFWIPLMGWCRVKEYSSIKNYFFTYIVLFVYSFLDVALYQVIFKPLLHLTISVENWDSRGPLIFSYRDNMTFLSSLNFVRLITMFPLFRRNHSQNMRGKITKGDGFFHILFIIGAVFFVWIFTAISLSMIEENMTFAKFLAFGFSSRSLMNNLIYFNLAILTALVFYQNWEMQNNTARKLTERGDILTIILENISEGVLVLDKDWNIVFGNSAVIKMGNYSENVIGQSIVKIALLYYTDGEPMEQNEIVKKLTSGDVLNCLLRTTIGNYKRIQIHVTTLPQSRYGFKYLSLVRDITEEYEQEQKNLHTQKQEAIGRLVGGVAHDFNNRLAGIMGFSQLIEEEDDPAKIREYARYIVDSSQAATDLTSQLLTLSRKRPMEEKKLDLCLLLENLIPMLYQTLDRGIELYIQRSEEPLNILGDTSLLENAIINLSVNASHAMKKKGTITFDIGTMLVDDIYSLKSHASLTPGRYACLKVLDTGSGIKSDLRDKIFDPFFTTKQEGEGTGLGLSTVREVIEKHGGEITLDTAYKGGTCFVIILPLIQEPPQHL